MNKTQKKVWVERRQAVDGWYYIKSILAVISWLVFLFALVMSYYAAPETNYGVVRYYDLEIRQFWLTPLTGYLYILLWLSALGSYLSMIVGKYRSRRKIDHAEYNLIFLLSINLIWLSYLLYQIHLVKQS
ncbi:hypothetical protein [Colwellia sp. RSH04]|uniref:hypothetical protein n=1 Tax=Colwellia sp. RSH04 TaxID=2305464 RepID=UPI000E5695B5|nr:hypothetical protein [Colwellia sp. RSH04]RHW77144.1 hypothetical protein D1094_04430 [Colwellia sp. RSH04]